MQHLSRASWSKAAGNFRSKQLIQALGIHHGFLKKIFLGWVQSIRHDLRVQDIYFSSLTGIVSTW